MGGSVKRSGFDPLQRLLLSTLLLAVLLAKVLLGGGTP